MTAKQFVKWFQAVRRADRAMGIAFGARSLDPLAGFGLGVRCVGAGLIVVLAVLQLALTMHIAPQLGGVVGLVYGVLIYLAAVLIYPSWGAVIQFHVGFVLQMAIFPLIAAAWAVMGFSAQIMLEGFLASWALAFGFMLSFEILGWITQMILSAFEPPRYVWGSRRWARHNARVIRRAQRRQMRRAQRGLGNA